MNGIKLLLGTLALVMFVSAVTSHPQKQNANRIKRFLLGPIDYKVEQSCCLCDDLANDIPCYERCRSGQAIKNAFQCPGGACLTTATLIGGTFQLMSSCTNITTCQGQATTPEDAAKKGCDRLNKDDMKGGTICGYCCDPSNESPFACISKLGTRVDQTHSQNIGETSSSSSTESAKTSTSISTSNSTITQSVLNETSSSLTRSSATTVRQSIHTSTKHVPTSSSITPNTSRLPTEPSCETCTNGTNCNITTCNIRDSYCENVIEFNNGIPHIIKKGCASYYECKFDHSTRNSECDPNRNISIISHSYFICHYCCLATNKSAPCNANNIPENLLWFDEKTSVSPTLKPSVSLVNTTGSRLDQSVSTLASSISAEIPHRNPNVSSVTQPISTIASLFSSATTHVNASHVSPVTSSVSSVTSTVNKDTSSISSVKSPIKTDTSPVYSVTPHIKTDASPVSSFASPIKTSTSPVSSTTLSSETLKQSMPTTPPSVASVHTTKSFDNSSITSPKSPLKSTTSSIITKVKGSVSTLILNSTKLHTSSFNTSSKTSKSQISSTLNMLKTTGQSAVKTTKKSGPVTLSPSTSVRCKVCSGPEFLCEKLYEDQECVYPNNYCLNTIRNHIDGSRSVNRRCDNFNSCYINWFLGSSDVDKCRDYDEDQIITLDFDCTFCCIKNGCNLPLRPKDDSLYKDD